MANPNPPAFPVPFEGGQPGMTLRDWFAGQALVGWISGPCQGDALADYDADDVHTLRAWATHNRKVAEACYDYADALLAARQTKEKP